MRNFNFIIDIVLDNSLHEHLDLGQKWKLHFEYLIRNERIKPKVEINNDLISFVFNKFVIDIATQRALKNKYNTLVKNEIEDTGFQVIKNWFGYECVGIPNKKVCSHSIIIKFLSDETLKNIGKTVECTDLYLKSMDKIEEDGLLGLTLIKGLQNLSYSDAKDEKQLDALKILKNNISNQLDMLDCQEDLIIKGFKKYAKL